MSFFDLTDILSSEERIPCRTLPGDDAVPGLGFLDPAAASKDLEPDVKLELPAWMVHALTRRARIKLTVNLPAIYTHEKRCGQLRADPAVLDLPKCGPHNFYATGEILMLFAAASDAESDVEVKTEEELGPVMVDVLTKRFRYILDCSFNADESDAPFKMTRLDNFERRLYEEGQRSQRQLNAWFRRKTDVISASDMVSRHRKRKAALIATS